MKSILLEPRLWSLMDEAGMPPEGMRAIQSCISPDDAANAALMEGIARTLLPLMERTGVATAEETHITSLPQRLADELKAARPSAALPASFGAWAKVRD